MSGLAYDAPENETGRSGPSSPGPDVHPNGRPTSPYDAGGLADDYYFAPRMSPQHVLDMPC